MDSLVYWENGNRKVLTSDEFIAMVCPSDSEDGLEFDDSDEDPTINVQDLESSDSDSEPGTDIQTVPNSSMNDIAKGHVHENSPSAPEIANASQIHVTSSRRTVKKRLCGKIKVFLPLLISSHSWEMTNYNKQLLSYLHLTNFLNISSLMKLYQKL